MTPENAAASSFLTTAWQPGDTWAAFSRRIIAAVSEGYCPVHDTPLMPVQTRPGETAGYCAACRQRWFLNPAARTIGAQHGPPGGSRDRAR